MFGSSERSEKQYHRRLHKEGVYCQNFIVSDMSHMQDRIQSHQTVFLFHNLGICWDDYQIIRIRVFVIDCLSQIPIY